MKEEPNEFDHLSDDVILHKYHEALKECSVVLRDEFKRKELAKRAEKLEEAVSYRVMSLVNHRYLYNLQSIREEMEQGYYLDSEEY